MREISNLLSTNLATLKVSAAWGFGLNKAFYSPNLIKAIRTIFLHSLARFSYFYAVFRSIQNLHITRLLLLSKNEKKC